MSNPEYPHFKVEKTDQLGGYSITEMKCICGDTERHGHGSYVSIQGAIDEFYNEHANCGPSKPISAGDIPGLTPGMKHYLQAGHQYRVGSESGRDKTEPEDQPMPVQNDLPHIHDLVVADLAARKALGIRRYGTALQPFNGRDALQDVYEELLDAACYIRQRIEEEKRKAAENG